MVNVSAISVSRAVMLVRSASQDTGVHLKDTVLVSFGQLPSSHGK